MLTRASVEQGIPRLINQICDISLTYGFAEQNRHSLRVSWWPKRPSIEAEAGFFQLGVTEELSALAASADDPKKFLFPIPPA